jgi:hypothetical protein
MSFERNTFISEFGFIDYHYKFPCEKYPNGLLLFMGSHILKEHREKGHFKDMVFELFAKFPEDTVVQVALSNKNLVSFFERLGFIKVDSIEYWGGTDNTIKLQGLT